ncbi:putative non-specific serine/threonine protein kinase [Helianthus annuus]|nr:putative non-specific serine/threonine protein kinase [Helianthus annuus]KAJ0684751.1 putative non-specific serine/threonine protein kinase [Helianthus annuus]
MAYFTGTTKHEFEHDLENTSGGEDLELPLFGLSTLLKATNNFSMDNKLGEGGFGPVYKWFCVSMDVGETWVRILGSAFVFPCF